MHNHLLTFLPILLLLSPQIPQITAWRKWEYSSQTDTGYTSSNLDAQPALSAEWQKTWKGSTGPGSRRGHTIVLLGTKLILFAGRSNEIQKTHVPKTYKITDIDGILEVSERSVGGVEGDEITSH